MDKSKKYKVKVCHGGSCRCNFAEEVKKNLEKEIVNKKIENVEVEQSGCMGFCGQSPNIVVIDEETYASEVKTNLNPSTIAKELFKDV